MRPITGRSRAVLGLVGCSFAALCLTMCRLAIALESLLRCTIRGWYNRDVRDLEPASAQQAGHETWQHDLNAQEIIKRNQGRSPDDRANLNTWLYEDHGCDREYANAPLKHVNPKGFVDSWRTPKYFYYLWQAVYAEKPMVFIHPHFWRSQYLGQKKEIAVDSNCDTVELKVNGHGGDKYSWYSWYTAVIYTRETLDVFPPEEWESKKNDLILETWVEAAIRDASRHEAATGAAVPASPP